MNNVDTGRLIKLLRTERGLTQRELADILSVSDKAVSKWERGGGAPDISILPELSSTLGVEIEGLINGGDARNGTTSGNIKRLKFYHCPRCGETAVTFGNAKVSCCSRELAPLAARAADAEHIVSNEMSDGEWYVTIEHPMQKDHHICLAVLVTWDRFITMRLYPEQPASFRLPAARGAKLYTLCTKHGLFVTKLG